MESHPLSVCHSRLQNINLGYFVLQQTSWQGLIMCDFGAEWESGALAWGGCRWRWGLFSNQSNSRFVVTCSRTDKSGISWLFLSPSELSDTPKKKKKYSYRGKQGDEAPQPYPGKEMASYQIKLGSLFYGVNLDRGDKEMTHPLRTQRGEEISPPAAYMALVQSDRQRIERSWNNNPSILLL